MAHAVCQPSPFSYSIVLTSSTVTAIPQGDLICAAAVEGIMASSSSSAVSSSLPLAGLKVVEFAGLAPGPMVGLVLADFGADVIRIDKVGAGLNADGLCRGKRSIAVDPKTGEGLRTLRRLVAQADVLIDPFRPNVLERLGLGPAEVAHGWKQEGVEGNARLVYARLTGFQRTGAPQMTWRGRLYRRG